MVSQWFADPSGSVGSYEAGSPVDSAVTNNKNSFGVLCAINRDGFTQTLIEHTHNTRMTECSHTTVEDCICLMKFKYLISA
jgi:hypothetical protein